MILNTYSDGQHFSIVGCAGYVTHSYGVISEHHLPVTSTFHGAAGLK